MVNNGFRRLRYHDLRHSSASLLLACGVPLKQIQEWLGHSSFAITADTYAHLDYHSKLQSAKAMSWIEQTSLTKLPGLLPVFEGVQEDAQEHQKAANI